MAQTCPDIVELSDFCVLTNEFGEIYSVAPPCRRPDLECLKTLEGNSYEFLWNLLYAAVSILLFLSGCWVGRFVYIKFLILRSDFTMWVLFFASFGGTFGRDGNQTRDLEAGPSAPLEPPSYSSLQITQSEN